MTRITGEPITVGSAIARPGALSYGTFEGVGLPTGGTDALPVIIAAGEQPGPTLWITAGIHGNEYTGISVIHELLTAKLASGLRGTIVAIPCLNPAALRTGDRRAYYARLLDPNRLFPAPLVTTALQSVRPESVDPEPPTMLEAVYLRLFEVIRSTATYLIDLHNYSLGAFPFAFRDPVGYRTDDERPQARELLHKTDELLAALGLTVINEFATVNYLRKALHRSVSGAALHIGRIPAVTVELGGYLTVDPVIVKVASAGLRNVLRWAHMLDGSAEPVRDVPVLRPDHALKRMQHPFAPCAGIVQFLVKVGDAVTKGDPVARISDIWGRPITAVNNPHAADKKLKDGLITSRYDGFVLGLGQGSAFYENEPLMTLAVRDDSDPLIRLTSYGV